MRFGEVGAILAELRGTLPAGIEGLSPAQLEAAWPTWIERHDRDVRARLEQGDEDTLVNWLLFGTSFTARPRAVLGAVQSGTADDQALVVRRTIELIAARLDDLVQALTVPGRDERRLFARAVLQRKGIRLATDADREAAREYLLKAVIRVASEQDEIEQDLGATSGGDAMAEFVKRSRLFRARGLSLDTSPVTNYSVEQALGAMKARGVLGPGAVKRVAIVGPGLDFADKDVGFDSYPLQTLQPFAVLDAVKRLGLAPSPMDPEIVLLDISPRVIDHVTRARAQAAKGVGYTLNLLLPHSTPWVPEVRAYWQRFGNQIGAVVDAAPSKAIAALAARRVVRIAPAAVQRVSVLNVNIVTDRLDAERFDLVIATNVFIYYDVLDQALAMSNIEAIVKPGGFLIANASVPTLRSIGLQPVETTATLYARGGGVTENILDFVVWYQARGR